MENIQLSQYGKTCPEHSQATAARTSDACSKRSQGSKTSKLIFLCLIKASGQEQEPSWATVGRLPGECWTPNTGESPSVAVESTLSQILQADAPGKYYLSAKACAGILRRAQRRGKEIPTILREALEEVIALNA